jgi:uracil-DNA glycosylase
VATPFDPGPAQEPFASLAAAAPGASTYPPEDFRTEWGPIFHRGRLDGTARVLVVGQDPAQHETIARRILVGEAGHRLQGLLFKLGVDRSYVMINTFLFSVFGQAGGERHAADRAITRYRHRWLQAIFQTSPIEAVLALGHLADDAWARFARTNAGKAVTASYVHVTHPTQPESASRGNEAKHEQLIAAMLANWNEGMQAIAPAIAHPDTARQLVLYGQAFADGDRKPIPQGDLPAGSPSWMAVDDGWAARTGATAAKKRATITVTVPASELPTTT